MKQWLSIVVLIIAFSGGLMIAQDEDANSDEADITLTCDPAELIVEKIELDLLLEEISSEITDDPETALENLYTVGAAYQEMALSCGYIPDDIGELTVGTDVERILTALESVQADPLNGQLLYNIDPAADGNVTGCVGCHSEESVAPLTEGTWTRWDEIYSLEDQFADYTFEQYIIESVVHPWDYTAPDYPEGTMPNNFGDRLSYQNMADLIAYLESQDQLLDE